MAESEPNVEATTPNKIGDYLREFIFQQDDVQRPELKLSDISHYEVNTTRSQAFFIPSQPGQIGAWFLEPEEDTAEERVILYLHGVKGTRGRIHRVGLYNFLLREGFKILTIDYRGAGDSTDTSETEDTVVQDARVALEWLRNKVGDNSQIFVWGHSMGTGVASHAVAEEFIDKGACANIDGVILEAPFNNFTEEMVYYTKNTGNVFAQSALSALYASTGQTLPGALLSFFNMEFNSDFWLPQVDCPVMILHAKGDEKIPIHLAEKLFETVKASGKVNIEFNSFDETFEHHTIYKSEKLPILVINFTENAILEKRFVSKRSVEDDKSIPQPNDHLLSMESYQMIIIVIFFAFLATYFKPWVSPS